MGLFGKRKTRATRRAEARAIKAKAKLEAKLAAKNEVRRFKAAQRAETKHLREQLRTQRGRDQAAVKIAEVRGLIDQRRADQLGVPLSQIGQFSGHGGQLSARVAGAEQSLQAVHASKRKDAETKQFVAAISERLTDLSAAITAAENMPATRRRGAHAAISRQLDEVDADLMARLGLS